MKPLLLLLILAHADWPVYFINELESIQVSTENQDVTLVNLALGQNLTFGVSGEYYAEDGTVLEVPPPEIFQRVVPISEFPKQEAGEPNRWVGFVQDPTSSTYFYTVNDNKLLVWYVDFVDVFQYDYSEYLMPHPIDTLRAFQLEGYPTILVMVSVVDSHTVFQFGYNLLYFMMLNSTWTYIGSPLTTLTDFNCRVDTARGGLDCFVIGTLSEPIMTAYLVVPSASGFEVQNYGNYTASSLRVQTFQPFSVLIMGLFVGFCDSVNGVLFYIAEVFMLRFKQPPTQFANPVIEQKFLACSQSGDLLLIGTSIGLYSYYVMTLPSLDITFQTFAPAYSDGSSIVSISQLAGSSDQTILAAILQAESGEMSLRLMTMDQQVSTFSFIILDERVCSFMTECEDIPSILIVPSFVDQPILVLETIDAVSFAWVAQYQLMSFFADAPCVFRGNFSVWTSSQTPAAQVPIVVHISDISSTQIYTSRNMQPDNWFLRDTNVTRPLNSADSIHAPVYIPLNNYFSGHCIDYNVTVLQGDTDYVTFSIPPVLTLNASYSFQHTTETPAMFTMALGDAIVVAVVSEDGVHLFDGHDYDRMQPSSSLPTWGSAFRVTQVVAVSEQSAIVVESVKADANSQYEYRWDLYRVEDLSNPTAGSKLWILSSDSWGQLCGGSSLLLSLRQEGIYVYQITEDSFEKMMLITNDSLSLPSFVPQAMCTLNDSSDFLVVLTSDCSVMVLAIQDFTTVFVMYTHLDVCEDARDASISCDFETFLVSSPSMAILNQYKALYDENSWIFAVPRPSQFLSSMIYEYLLAVQSVWAGNYSLNIFDRYTSELANLVTIVEMGSVPAYSFFSQGPGVHRIITYDGTTMTRYTLGQTAPHWNPTSYLISPLVGKQYTQWVKVDFNFQSLVNRLEYTASIRITATSRFTGLSNSTDVTIALTNMGAFIMKSSSYSGNSPLLSTQTVNVGSEPLVVPVPEGYFEGADIAYAFIVNESPATPSYPTAHCDRKSAVACITTKYEVTDFEPLPRDSFIEVVVQNDYYYFSQWNGVLRMSRADNSTTFFNVTEEMRSTQQLFCTTDAVRGAEDLLVVYCEGLLVYHFLVQLNTTSAEFVYVNTTNRPITLLAGFDSVLRRTKIYVITRSEISVFTVENQVMRQSAQMTSYSLDVIVFFPYSGVYLSDDFFIVSNFGFEAVFVLQSSSAGVYSVYQTIQIAPLLSGSTSTLELSPDNTLLLVLVNNSTLYRYSLWDATETLWLTLQQTIPMVASDVDEVVNSVHFATDGEVACFCVAENQRLKVRVANFSAPYRSQVITSADLAVRRSSEDSCTVQFLSRSQTELQVLFSLYPVNIFKKIVVRLSAMAFVFPQTGGSNQMIRLQLLAFNVASKNQGPVFLVNFTE